MKRVIVTGAGGSAANNFIESLRLADEEFHVVGTDIQREFLELPDVDAAYEIPPASDPDYIDCMNKIIDREDIDILHPQPDVEVNFISEHRSKFDATTLLPDHEVVEVCHNKMKLNRVLNEAGVSRPASRLIESEKGVDTAIENLQKRTGQVWLRAIRGAGSRAAIPITEPEHAKFWIDYWQQMHDIGYGDFMMSEFLPGKEFAFQSIWKDGELITSQARERMQYVFGNQTVSGQSSSPSVARTVHREDVNEVATAAIKSAAPDASGIFCVDMKENTDGQPCITEINLGRFFTTSNFFSHAGSNMPYYFVKMALNEAIPDQQTYNAVPADLYWIRRIDSGYQMVEAGEWRSHRLCD